MKIKLQKDFFQEKEKELLSSGNLKASLFKYDSGINAIRLENEVGYIVVLPYNGQMIWDAYFYGRSIKMETPFEQPVASEFFGGSYGCYLMHCGMTAMGGPKATDTHPPHGDLPYADFVDASLVAGSNEKGNYLEISSSYEKNIAFDEHYLAQPSVKLYENSGMLEVHVHAKNLSRKKMNLMYLCHINNKLVPEAEISQTLPWDSAHMKIQALPNNPSEDLTKLFNRISEEPKTSNPVKEKEYHDPETVFFLRNMNVDKNNHAHFLHVLPDGSADYTHFDADVLNHGVRWIAYHDNCHSMGMVLPSTAESEGYTAEKAKGNLRYLAPTETFDATVYCGAVKAEEASKIRDEIEKINA